MDNTHAATRLFHIPELLELILLSLPWDKLHEEMSSMRTILLGRTTSRTWHDLISHSTLIRQKLYLSKPADSADSKTWQQKHAFPSAAPNPWIPDLLLRQRSWGSAWPFDTASTYSQLSNDTSASATPSTRYWTFSFEMSRPQYNRLPPPGPWRNMLISSPPFTDFWYTRSFYELGSGRAPFVTHLDYDAKFSIAEQRFRRCCGQGVTVGDVVDAVSELMRLYSDAKFVMIESIRFDTDVVLSEDRPTTKSHMPGMSAEKDMGWHGAS